MTSTLRSSLALTGGVWILAAAALAADPSFDYKLLATSKTSTMEKEMNEAAQSGFVFGGVMGGETSLGGNEVVVVMRKAASQTAGGHKRYLLLATSKTSTMQKEMQAAGDQGFEYLGQTVFQSAFGGREVAVIMERDAEGSPGRREFLLLATTRTSTMEKELNEAGSKGFRLLGVTVSKTKFGGSEVLSILGREPQ